MELTMTKQELRCADKPNALFVDLYELTMMQAYLREGLNGTASFNLFVRRLPPVRNYLLACGLETVLDFLESISFSKDDISYLTSFRMFDCCKQPDHESVKQCKRRMSSRILLLEPSGSAPSKEPLYGDRASCKEAKDTG